MPELFDPTTMPGDNMSPGQIEAAATSLGGVGTKVSTRGGTVLTRWQGLSAVYDAPEETTLTQAMDPVKTKAEAFGTDLGSAAKALDGFADQVRTIKAEVAKIRADAASFLGGIKDGKVSVTYYGGGDYYTEPFDWHTDQDTVDANNALVRRTHDQQEALWAAERVCASAIRAAVGLGAVVAADAAHPNGYQVAELPDDAPMPWGSTVQRTESCLEKAGEGLVDAGGAALAGAGNLLGISYSDGDWDWALSTAGEAWKGVAMFGVGVVTFGPGGLALANAAPGPVGQFLRDSQFMVPAAVAGLVGIDLYAKDPLQGWKDDPAHASGELLFNAATLPLAATRVSKAGLLGRVGRRTPDAADATPPRGKLPDGSDVARAADPGAVKDLVGQADLDESLAIRTDLDLEAGPGTRVGDDGPPNGRADADRPPTDRESDSVPGDRRGEPGPADPDRADSGSESADADRAPADPADRGDRSRTEDGPPIGSGQGTKDDKYVYGYRNRAEALHDAPVPDLDQAATLGPAKLYDSGTAQHLEASWRDYLDRKAKEHKTPQTWERWRNGYIANQGNDPRGKAYELAYRDVNDYDAREGYEFRKSLREKTGIDRNYDIFSVKDTTGIELKSKAYIDEAQLAKDVQLVRSGWSIRYVFGTEPSAAMLERLTRLGVDVEVFYGVPVLIE